MACLGVSNGADRGDGNMILPTGQIIQGDALEISRPALRYRGGKWRTAPWIISHFPPHECYVEPFMGAASVFMQKEPSDFEVLNDRDGDVVAFFRALRERPEDLMEAIALTPYSRDEFKAALAPAVDTLERARRLYIRCWQGRGSSNENSGWRFQIQWHGWKMNIPRYFHKLEHLGVIAARLADVQIENGKAETVMERFDAPTTLHYLDPPYVLETRNKSPRLYKYEWSDDDHRHLAETAKGLKGMVLISGYPSGLYDELYAEWRRVEKTAYAEAQKQTIECLWISPKAMDGARVVQEPLGI